MLFKREKSTEYYLGDTHVENVFINELMTDAPGDYVKVYLFALMYAELGMIMTNDDIARHLLMDIEDVLKAWTYWEGKGVIRKYYENPSNKLLYEVEFINLKSLIYGKRRGRKKKQDDISAGIKDILANEELQQLCHEVESIVGAPLPSDWIKETLSWVSVNGAAPDVIKYAYRYAKNRPGNSNKGSASEINYVGKVVKSWTEKGFRTVDEVQAYLADTDKRHYQYKRVLKALGMSRGASEEEQRIMDTWFDAMALDMETVLEACKKSSGINSPNINYLNTVLVSWSKGGKNSRGGGGGGGTGGGGGGGTGGGGRQVSDSKKQIAEATRYFDRLRDQAETEAKKRRNEVYARVPEIKRLDDETRSKSMEISRVMLSGAPNAQAAIARIRKEMDGIKSERAFLMTENNFHIDYMDVKYSCEVCKDTGIKDSGERCSCFSLYLKSLDASLQKA